MESLQRAPGLKVWISHLFNLQKSPQDPNVFFFQQYKLSRVNILGVVVETYVNKENSYATLTLDDGSGRIVVKAWKEDVPNLQRFHTGEVALVLGRVKEGSPYYIQSEVARPLSETWLQFRKAELLKLYGQAPAAPVVKFTPRQSSSSDDEEMMTAVVEEKIDDTPSTNARGKILQLIESLNTGDGADYTQVVQQSGVSEAQAEQFIQDMLKDGEVFQMKPGRLALL